MSEMLFETEQPSEPKIKALAPWFGANRMLAENVGKELRGMKWVGVPFAGGMSELLYIDAPSILVSDLHRAIINLARVIQHDLLRAQLIERCDTLPFHPDVLGWSQKTCACYDSAPSALLTEPDLNWAINYFRCCWMGRSAKSGTDGELSGSLPIRWTSSGGDSNTRYRSAIASLDAFASVFKRCNFVCQDAFEFIGNCKDLAKHAIYVDAPWPDDGDKYKHKFDEQKQRQLAFILSNFKHAKIVIRYGEHPLIRELYHEPHWRYLEFGGRTQANNEKREVLICNDFRP